MDSLVNDLLYLIFNGLDLEDLVRIKLVSKKWNKLISSNYQDKSNGDIYMKENLIIFKTGIGRLSIYTKFGNRDFFIDLEGFDACRFEFYRLTKKFNQQKGRLSDGCKIVYSNKYNTEHFNIKNN